MLWKGKERLYKDEILSGTNWFMPKIRIKSQLLRLELRRNYNNKIKVKLYTYQIKNKVYLNIKFKVNKVVCIQSCGKTSCC